MGRIMCRIRKSTRTQKSRILRVYSTLLRSWWKNILKKFWWWDAWNIHHHHGRDQYWPMIKRSSGRRQKYVSTLIPFYVLDRWKTLQKQLKDEMDKGGDSGCIRLTKMQWVSMEKQLNLSGKISQGFRHCLFLKKSNKTWRSGRSSQRSSQTGSSSCQCSMIWYGKRMMRIVFRMPKKSRMTPRSSYQDIGRFWVQDRKRSGLAIPTITRTVALHRQTVELPPTRWYSDSKILVILSSKVPVFWVVESWCKRRGRCTMDFYGDFVNTELLFQIVHSVNQLSVYGAVANWCY